MGSYQALRHLDLSGCERITDAALQHLSRALGELAEEEGEGPEAWRSECTWAPHGCHLCLPEEQLGTQGDEAGRVWLLPEEDLLDIEEAGGLKIRSQRAAGAPHRETLPLPGSVAARCIRDAYCPQARAPCGHSLCAAGTKLRTNRLPQPQCNKMVRTRGPWPGPGSGRWRDGAEPDARSLRFLSLSGCFLITDHGLRYRLVKIKTEGAADAVNQEQKQKLLEKLSRSGS
eukprot:g18424.t1